MASDRQKYTRALRDIAERYGKMEYGTIHDIWQLLRDLERDVSAQVLASSGYNEWRLKELQKAIQYYLDVFNDAATAKLRAGIWSAGEYGAAYTNEPLVSVGLSSSGFNTLTPSILNVMAGASAELVSGISEDVLAFINRQLRQVALQQITPIDAMKALSQHMGFIDMRPGREVVKGVAYNAERIVRTELNRDFNLAAYSNQLLLNQRVDGLLKRWMAVGDLRTRESHLIAHVKYATNPIPVNELFEVGGELMMYPLDPNASAKETVNCRCRTVTIHPRVGVLYTTRDMDIQDELKRRSEALRMTDTLMYRGYPRWYLQSKSARVLSGQLRARAAVLDAGLRIVASSVL